MAMAETTLPRIEAQVGPQRTFQRTPADIAIYGGAAGGGKSFALLMEPLRHIGVSDFGCVIFRRTNVQVKNEGGLWDESMKLYPHAQAKPITHELWWKFPKGTSVAFAHLEYDKTVLDWQGSQIPLIEFDELTHFSEYQFFYMLSRNRSTCGVRPYVRASCNPDPDSWVARFISWWIDQETGYAIPERSGVLRWFVRIGDQIVWADEPEELLGYTNPIDGESIPPKSVTFVPSKLSDNKALMAADPGYVANLMALDTVERARLMDGNWKVRKAGGMFKREWFEIVDAIPSGAARIRSWDFASTEAKLKGKPPDWTAGVKLARPSNGVFYVENVSRAQEASHDVETRVLNTASQDGTSCRVTIPKDPAQAGTYQADTYIKKLAGYDVAAIPPTGDKETRARPAAAQAAAGNLKLLRGDWNQAFIDELCAFPNGANDDQVDGLSDALNDLALRPVVTSSVTPLRL